MQNLLELNSNCVLKRFVCDLMREYQKQIQNNVLSNNHLKEIFKKIPLTIDEVDKLVNQIEEKAQGRAETCILARRDRSGKELQLAEHRRLAAQEVLKEYANCKVNILCTQMQLAIVAPVLLNYLSQLNALKPLIDLMSKDDNSSKLNTQNYYSESQVKKSYDDLVVYKANIVKISDPNDKVKAMDFLVRLSVLLYFTQHPDDKLQKAYLKLPFAKTEDPRKALDEILSMQSIDLSQDSPVHSPRRQ